MSDDRDDLEIDVDDDGVTELDDVLELQQEQIESGDADDIAEVLTLQYNLIDTMIEQIATLQAEQTALRAHLDVSEGDASDVDADTADDAVRGEDWTRGFQ